MPDLTFSDDGRAYFPTKYHGEVSISKEKWDRICSAPERFYYRLNGDKVATTLISPDRVRHHRTIADQFIYYKEFDTFKITENVEGPGPWGRYFAVVIDTSTKRICTIYPTDTPKPGKDYKETSE